jgi:hypothetical protein
MTFGNIEIRARLIRDADTNAEAGPEIRPG